jgi:hypothetical protein
MTDLAIIGASIRTLDPARPHASAVAVRDGIVIAVDSRAPASSARRTRSATVPWRRRSTPIATPGGALRPRIGSST